MHSRLHVSLLGSLLGRKHLSLLLHLSLLNLELILTPALWYANLRAAESTHHRRHHSHHLHLSGSQQETIRLPANPVASLPIVKWRLTCCHMYGLYCGMPPMPGH